MRRRARPARDPVPEPGAPAYGSPVGAGAGADHSASADSSDLLAGYRVLRRLGSGSRSDVYLGHPGHGHEATAASEATAMSEATEAPSAAPTEDTGGSSGVALKVFGADTDPASIERDIRALTQVPAGRLPALLDVATLPDGRVCLVLERLAGPSLGRHLSLVDRLEPGEAVTILAPVVTAVSALHEAGFGHDGIGPSSVLFDENRRPVLAGLGALLELPPHGAARIAALRADYLRLGLLVRAVFDCLGPLDPTVPAAGRLAAWFDERAAEVPFRACLDDLERRLFALAPATAVRQAQAGTAAHTPRLPAPRLPGASAPGTGRAASGGGIVAHDPRGGEAPQQPGRWRLPGWFAVFHLPPELRAAVAERLAANPSAGGMARGMARGMTGGMTRLREGARRRRRPVLLAAVLAAALVLPAVGLLPESAGREGSGQSGRGQSGTPGSGSEQSGTQGSGTQKSGAQGSGTEGTGTGQSGQHRSGTAAGTDPSTLAASDSAALAGDEPVLAVPVLLRLRAGCLAAASVVCLDAVEQPGSAIMAADSYGARSAQQGGRAADTPTFEEYTASLVERTGNSALVALAPADGPAGAGRRPASALVVKGEAGWRLREIFDY